MKTACSFKQGASCVKKLFALLFFINNFSAISQTEGEFQSRQSGHWNQSSTWQQWNGIKWVNLIGTDLFPKVASTAVSRVNADATTHTVVMPTGIVAGDLLVLLWTDFANGTSTIGGAELGTWTLLYENNTSGNRRAAYYKNALGTEAASMVVTSSANEQSAHNVYRIAAGTWQGEPEVSPVNTTNTANPTPPTFDPWAWDQEPTLWLISNHIAGDGGIAITAPPNYVSNLIRIGTGGGGGGGDATMSSSYRAFNTLAETPGSFTNGQSRSTSAATIAIKGKLLPVFPKTMFPVVASTASSAEAGDTKTHTIALPSGITTGDLLLVFYADKNAATTITTTGWTELYNNLDVASKFRRAAYYRIADGSEGGTAVFGTSANERSAHTSYRILKGTFQGTPIAASPVSSSTDTKIPNPPDHDPGWGSKNILWIAALHSSGDDNNQSPQIPLDYTNMVTGYTGGSGTGQARVVTAQRELAIASENPGSFTLSSNVNWAANTVAIQGSGLATVLATHTVTVTQNVSVPEVRVNAGGTVSINNGISFTTPASGSFTVSGTLQTGTDGTANLVGAGTFSLNSGGSLWVSSPAGISASANTGNIRVTGSRSFHSAANYHYNGTSDQLTGDAVTVANNFSVSGASVKTLSNNITVNGTLTFNDARILSAPDKLLTMVKANSILGYGQNGMVIGSLKIIGTGSAVPYDVVFPLRGKSQLQTVKIKYNAQSNTDAMTVTYLGNAYGGNKSQDIDEVSSLEYWDITPSWTTGSLNAQNGVAVDIAYRSSSTGKYFPNRIEQSYGLGHFSGTQWEIAGPMNTLVHTTADNGISGSVSMGAIKSFSPFTPIAINPTMLPVDLGAFTAKETAAGKVELNWTTYAESLNKGFRVERMIQGTNKGFESIGYVFSKSLNGNSVVVLKYEFVDHVPVAGKTSLYRIVQEDLDGKVTPSEVKRVNISALPKIQLYPNPSSGSLVFSGPVAGKNYELTVMDLSGNRIQQFTPISEIPFRFTIRPTGLYSIKIMNLDTRECTFQRVMIQR